MMRAEGFIRHGTATRLYHLSPLPAPRSPGAEPPLP